MPALRLKLAGSLLAGGLAGVAALASLSGTSSVQLSPAGDSTDATTQQTVEQPAPCPTGTVEHADSCDRIVKVQSDDVQQTPAAVTPPAAPVSVPVAVPAATQDAEDTGQQGEHQDADENEQEGDHQDAEDAGRQDQHDGESADDAEHESDD